jgi:hypothetical protein
MAITETHQSSATIGASILYLASNSPTPTWQGTDGVYQLWLDLVNLANGDEFRLTVHERISSGGTSREVQRWYFANAQLSAMFVTPSLILMHGWEFSLIKTLGTDRSIAWSIRQVA